MGYNTENKKLINIGKLSDIAPSNVNDSGKLSKIPGSPPTLFTANKQEAGSTKNIIAALNISL